MKSSGLEVLSTAITIFFVVIIILSVFVFFFVVIFKIDYFFCKDQVFLHFFYRKYTKQNVFICVSFHGC